MPNRGKFIGGQDNLYVPDAPTVGTATGGDESVSVAFTAPSDVGNDDITAYGASATDGTNVIGATGSSSPVTVTGLTNGTSYTAQVWAINDYGNGPLSSASNSFSPSLSRAIFIWNNVLDFVTITTTGNATDFGNPNNGQKAIGAFSSDTRAVFTGGINQNSAQYFTMATTGNALNFGDLTERRTYSGGGGNNVRGITAGGDNYNASPPGGAVIDYLTIATTGNAIDFGDRTVVAQQGSASAGSITRLIMAGGAVDGDYGNTMDFITIASAGNATDFGDLSIGKKLGGALASATRMLYGGGRTDDDGEINTIERVTIASAGNATDFGDLTVARKGVFGCASATRGLFAGGDPAGSTTSNVIDYITIASTGNATDFGDMTQSTDEDHGAAVCSETPAAQNESYFAPAAMGLIAHGRLVGIGQTAVSYIDIATTGRLALFGDLSGPSMYVISGGAASTTRGVFAGIHTASGSLGDDLEFFTFSTKGKSTDFGDATQILYGSMGSNSTRGVLQVGYDGSTYTINTIEYITIASAGNTTDFGDLTEGGSRSAPAGSTTRLLFMGRDAYGTGTQNGSDTVDYVTIASTGNATDFGNLATAIHYAAGVSSNTRAVKCGGWSNSNTTAVNEIDYFTIASTGNATDFGDLTVARGGMAGCSSKVRGVLGTGANATGGSTNVLDYITIASTGNAVDWGDWYASHTSNRFGVGGVSNSHGGLA